MKPLPLAGWRPILTAFSIWFLHFMLCWAAVEIWPRRPLANVLGGVFTAAALLAMALHARRLTATAPESELGAWSRRFAFGAIALATVSVLFVALPSLVLVP